MCCKLRLGNQHFVWIRWFYYIIDICAVIYKYFMRAVSPILFGFANLLILSVALIFFFLFIPELFKDSVLLHSLNVFIGLYLYINIAFHHAACCLVSPGSPSYCPDPGSLLGEKVSIVDGRRIYQFSYQLNVAQFVSYKYCHTCKCIKPPRTHHCSVSGKCIYNMDHYCPWMNTCVGFYNYRHFVMFLVYLQAGCIYVMTVLLSHRTIVAPLDRRFIIWTSSILQNLIVGAPMIPASGYCFTLVLAASISSGILLVWHTYLCITNQTTIDFYINFRNRQEASSAGITYRNPYDEGLRKNLRRVFGSVPWYRILLPSLHKPAEPKYAFELKNRVELTSFNV